MSNQEFSLGSAFPEAARAQWHERIHKDLKGASFDKRLVTQTADGIRIQPVYSGDETLPPIAPPGFGDGRRGTSACGTSQSGWHLCAAHRLTDERTTNRAMLEDLRGGASSLLLNRPSTDNSSTPPPPYASNWQGIDMDRLFADIHLDMIRLAFAPGSQVLSLAVEVFAWAHRQGVDLKALHVDFQADPLGACAGNGSLPTSLSHCFDKMASLAAFCNAEAPGCTAVTVDTLAHHWAGATPVQECAIAAATGVAYLRALTERGLDLAQMARQLTFHFALDSHFFANIAKLRAFRVIWSRVLEACGLAQSERPVRLHVSSSPRSQTQFDPWVNLLRGTATCFAGALGGAESVVVAAYDAALETPSDLGRRYARNTHLLLAEESHLADVIDPAGGSWFIEHLTNELADKAWTSFQSIESQGGMTAYLRQGRLAAALEKSLHRRQERVATRKLPITGVSEFPNLDERLPSNASNERPSSTTDANLTLPALPDFREGSGLDPARAWFIEAMTLRNQTPTPCILELSRGTGDPTDELIVPPLSRVTDAASFEQLRRASDRFFDDQGHRPTVFLANLGKPKQYLSRNTFARNFFEAGGIQAVDQGGFPDPDSCTQAFVESGCRLAVICSNDATYTTSAEAMANALKQAGAKTLFLAGRPGEHEERLRQAGIDDFIYMGCNLIRILSACAEQEGMLA